jgi:hypothetical protein
MVLGVWVEIPTTANMAITAAVPHVPSRFKNRSSFQQSKDKKTLGASNYSRREKFPFPF